MQIVIFICIKLTKGRGGKFDHRCLRTRLAGADHFFRTDDRIKVFGGNTVGDRFLAQGCAILVRGLGDFFGPVLAVTAFDSEDEAISLANSTDYGLAGGLWTADLSRAHRMIAEMRTGVVHVNTYGGPDVTVPMGGRKGSGNGHDKSLHAFDKFVDLKTAWIKL